MTLNLTSRQKESLLIYFFSVCIIFSNAYVVLTNHDATWSVDEGAYRSMAQGNFDIHPAYRYRAYVPLLVMALSEFLNFMQQLLPFNTHTSGVSVGFSYLLVNTAIMGLVGLLTYRVCKGLGATGFGSLFGLFAVLSSGFCTYICGLALVDSLYVLSLVMLLYAVVYRVTWVLLLSILIGPVAKESYWMFLPFIFYFCRFIPWYKIVVTVIISAGLFMLIHYIIDRQIGYQESGRAVMVLRNYQNMLTFPFRLLSFRGLMAFFSVYGFFYFMLLAGLFTKVLNFKLTNFKVQLCLAFLAIIVGHMLLNKDMARMWYFSAPVIAVMLALIFDRLVLKYFWPAKVHPVVNRPGA